MLAGFLACQTARLQYLNNSCNLVCVSISYSPKINFYHCLSCTCRIFAELSEHFSKTPSSASLQRRRPGDNRSAVCALHGELHGRNSVRRQVRGRRVHPRRCYVLEVQGDPRCTPLLHKSTALVPRCKKPIHPSYNILLVLEA